MKPLYLIALLGIVLTCCQKSKNDPKFRFSELEKTSWLIGTWQNSSSDGELSEKWEKVNDSTYQGNGYFIKGKDTLHHEAIKLTQIGEEVIYTATVQGQNNNKPIEFKMTNFSEKRLVFENQAHDYPKKIAYNKISNDSLVAEISGIQQGKASIESYPMKRQ